MQRMLLTALMATLLSSFAFAQSQRAPSTMEVYSEDGSKFILYLNGAQQNKKASDRVILSDLTANGYMIKVEFKKNKSTTPLQRHFPVRQQTDYVYSLRGTQNPSTGQDLSWEFYLISKTSQVNQTPAPQTVVQQIPIPNPQQSQSQPVAPAPQPVVQHIPIPNPQQPQPVAQTPQPAHTQPQPAPNRQPQPGATPQGQPQSQPIAHTPQPAQPQPTQPQVAPRRQPQPGATPQGPSQSQPIAQTPPQPAPRNSSITPAPAPAPRTSPNTSLTAADDGDGSISIGQPKPKPTPAPRRSNNTSLTAATTPPTPQPRQHKAPNNANSLCQPMSNSAFIAAKREVGRSMFSRDKLNSAKDIVSNNCVSANQIKRLAGMLPFQGDRMELAKFAYDYCADPQNYGELNNVFVFSQYRRELEQYVSLQR